MDQALVIEELVKLLAIVALGTRLFDRADEAVRSAVSQLPRFGALWSVVVVTIVVTFIKAPVITMIIIVACWVISLGSLIDFFFMALFGLVSINILVDYWWWSLTHTLYHQLLYKNHYKRHQT